MILIRHGESEFNVAFNRTGIDPGIQDPKLTARGRRQVREAAELLRARVKPIRRILASPYTRALQTAAIVAEALGLPMEVEPLVHEHACYQCDIGTPRSRLVDSWPALSFEHLDENWWPQLNETEAQLLDRARRFHSKAGALQDWTQVAVVTHWGFIRALTGYDARNAELVPFDPTHRR